MDKLPKRTMRGFTLIELMVTLAVVFTFAIIAYPSFEAVRQRAAVRDAAEQMLGFWNQARLESAKRNSLVKVGVVQSGSGAVLCLGAAAAADTTDTAPCDCTTAGACDVARFPADQAAWNRSTLVGVTLGGSSWPTTATMKVAFIEPRTTALTAADQAGVITLKGPPGRRAYSLRLTVDQFGRGALCEPSGATDKMSDYGERRC